MTKRRILVVAAALWASVLVALLVMARRNDGDFRTRASSGPAARGRAAPLVRPSADRPSPRLPAADPGAREPVESDPAEMPAGEHGARAPFKVDAQGRLILDPETRDEVEKLVLLSQGEELEAKLRRLEGSMPAEAAARVRLLTRQFRAYADEVKRQQPPGQGVRDEREALAHLEQVHQLRVKHFDAEAVEQLFGQEERLGRGMLQVSMLERDTSLSPEERMRRIKAIRDSLPEFEAIRFFNVASSSQATDDDHD